MSKKGGGEEEEEKEKEEEEEEEVDGRSFAVRLREINTEEEGTIKCTT